MHTNILWQKNNRQFITLKKEKALHLWSAFCLWGGRELYSIPDGFMNFLADITTFVPLIELRISS